LSEKQKVPVDLDMYIKKLANSRRRIILVNDILQNIQVGDKLLVDCTVVSIYSNAYD